MNLLRITAAAVVLLTAFGQDDLHTISEQEMDFIMNDIDDGDVCDYFFYFIVFKEN